MPSDYGHEQTDKELKRLERQITKEYSQAAKEVEKKLTDYLEKFAKKDAEMQKKVASGQMSAEEYGKWRLGQMAMGERWKEMQKTLTEDLVNADKIAAGMINDSLPSAYALNYNYGTYEVEHGAEIDTSFSLYDHATVENLMKKDPKIIPQARVDIPKDELWNRRKLTSAITQGILQGESIPKIAKRLGSVADMDRKAAIRNARTYTTAAENKGRVDSYERANNMGIPVKQMWMATLDDRTRAEHRHLDGQVRAVGEYFETDGYIILYPGDPRAEPEMIYNCRCTLVADIEGYQYQDERNNSKLGDMTYEEWKHAKDKPEKEESAKYDAEKGETKGFEYIRPEKDYAVLNEDIEDGKVKSLEVKELDRTLSHDEIVEKISGGDMTKGSCASVSLAYAGNTCGLDVTDYRGGQSQDVFADRDNILRMYRLAGADIQEYKVKNEMKDTAKILENLEVSNKEYVLLAGKHSAIIRNTEEFGLQYLELQSAKENGWKLFERDVETDYGIEHKNVAGMLNWRFGCLKNPVKVRNSDKIIEKRVELIDVSSVKPTEDFKEMLGYLNTSEGKQQKGEKGGIR